MNFKLLKNFLNLKPKPENKYNNLTCMKILQKSQIQEADRQTICLEPIASIELMERAAKACFQWICQHYNIDQKFTLLCGTGNNGGMDWHCIECFAKKNTPVPSLNFH